VIHVAEQKETDMDDMDRDDDVEEYDDDQLENIIIDHGILLNSIAALLVRKGILKQEEIEAEMERLEDEMNGLDGGGE
jgi:hypothetical protein